MSGNKEGEIMWMYKKNRYGVRTVFDRKRIG